MSEMDDPRLDEDARMDTLSTQDSSGAYDDSDQYYKEPTEIAATVRELQVALAAERARAPRQRSANCPMSAATRM